MGCRVEPATEPQGSLGLRILAAMADAAVEIVWGLHFAGLMASCSDCDASHRVTDRAELDAWAREHWLMEHPWAERVRVVHVID